MNRLRAPGSSPIGRSLVAHGGLDIGQTQICNGVRLQHGSIDVQTDVPGEGSAFVVALPLPATVPAVPETKPVTDKPTDETAACVVLAVDDNHDSADSLRILLRLLGVDARVAYDGRSALAALETLHPNVVLLDISMPGMDGYEVARRIRAQPALHDVRLVALTGGGGDTERERALAAGFDEHVVKPVSLASLQRLCGNPPSIH